MGGVEVWCDLLTRGLMARGHEVVVLAQRMKSDLPMPELPYPVHRFTRPPKQHLWAEVLAWPLQRLHKRYRFDLVMTVYGYPLGYATSVAKRRMDVGHVAVAHGNDLYAKFQNQRKLRLLRTTRLGYQRADHVICVSETMARRCRELMSKDPNPSPIFPSVTVVFNGIDMSLWRQTLAAVHDAPPDIARELGLEPGQFSLHVAGFRSVKRHDLAIRAMAAVRPLLQERRFKHVMLGEGKLLEECRQLAQSLGVADRVLFPGIRTGTAKAWLFANAKFLVNASDEEGLPIVLIEASASGLPVLVSDIDPHVDFIAGSGCGRTFKRGSADSLAEALREMIGADLSAMRAASAAHSRQFDLHKMLDGYESICQAVVARHAASH